MPLDYKMQNLRKGSSLVNNQELNSFTQCEIFIPSYKQILNSFFQDYLCLHCSLCLEMASYILTHPYQLFTCKVTKMIKKNDTEQNDQTCMVIGKGSLVLGSRFTSDMAMNQANEMFNDLNVLGMDSIHRNVFHNFIIQNCASVSLSVIDNITLPLYQT